MRVRGSGSGQGRRVLSAFARAEGGAAAVEFALTAVPFLGFVFVILQVALYHFAQQALDHATRSASRLVMTGAAQAQALSADQFRTTMLCPNLRMPLACSSITVSVTTVARAGEGLSAAKIYPFIQQGVPALAAVNLDPQKTSYCLGGPGDILFIDVAYSFMNVGGFLQRALGGAAAGAMVLRSTNLITNEPFSIATGSAQAGC
ncbi:TadE/TadG family type IV pilus assembly protein [Methylobacterium sp. A54F]